MRIDDRNLVFVDTETTGLDEEVHEVIEVAAILTDGTGKTVLRTFEAKLLPLHIETAEATALTINGYDPEKWFRKATAVPEVMEKLQDIQKGATMIGHNVSFDEKFLLSWLRQQKQKPTWHYHKLCTQTLSLPLFRAGKIENMKLDSVCAYFGVPRPEIHRAMNDAEACRQVFVKMTELYQTLLTGAKNV